MGDEYALQIVGDRIRIHNLSAQKRRKAIELAAKKAKIKAKRKAKREHREEKKLEREMRKQKKR